ncbi:hypothetical protein BJY04DRAFT_63505 [Aspergillus karnatakaensis]|uniref:uncharacterized protein n=1 Tax=Aspergillus karnatakaensis TaxID=1810916 RepID=UPI003CCD9D99
MPEPALPTQIRDAAAWEQHATKLGVKPSSLFQMLSDKYASIIQDRRFQYVALKALWKIGVPFQSKSWGIQDRSYAQSMLDTLPGWRAYLELVPESAPIGTILPVDNKDLGDFKLIWYYQQMIQRLSEPLIDTESNVRITRSKKSDDESQKGKAVLKDQTKGATKGVKALSFGSSGPVPTPRGRNSDSVSSTSDQSPLRGRGRSPRPRSHRDEGFQDELEGDLSSEPSSDPDFKRASGALDVFPAASDENIINSLLVAFASTVTFSFKGVKGHWTQERRRYKVQAEYKVNIKNKQTVVNKKLYEARTDGHLFIPNEKNSYSSVIIEVNPVTRNKCPRVRMQETAQMVAWIHAEPDEVDEKSGKKQRF